jgi:dCTP diphosphatase
MFMTQRQRVSDSSGGEAKGVSKSSLEELRDALRRFAAERDWDQFHFPKNLAIALSVEAAELLEHFQWLPDLESAVLPAETRAKIREELADVLLYLVRLADKLDIDLAAAAVDKLSVNAQKYPVDKARGTSKKYTDL